MGREWTIIDSSNSKADYEATMKADKYKYNTQKTQKGKVCRMCPDKAEHTMEIKNLYCTSERCKGEVEEDEGEDDDDDERCKFLKRVCMTFYKLI